MKYILGILILIGYTFNAWQITSKETKETFYIFNYVGVIVFPLGSLMGYIYVADKFGAFDKFEKEINVKTNIKK